jgi:hypothetical protein
MLNAFLQLLEYLKFRNLTADHRSSTDRTEISQILHNAIKMHTSERGKISYTAPSYY